MLMRLPLEERRKYLEKLQSNERRESLKRALSVYFEHRRK